MDLRLEFMLILVLVLLLNLFIKITNADIANTITPNTITVTSSSTTSTTIAANDLNNSTISTSIISTTTTIYPEKCGIVANYCLKQRGARLLILLPASGDFIATVPK